MRLALALVASAVLAAPASAAPPDVIRTGGPSRPADAKIAIVATTKSLNGKPFRVLDAAGRVVEAGKLARAPGAASPWKHAAHADLSAMTAPGGYVVAAGRLRSRP